jgi:hypothetical protein
MRELAADFGRLFGRWTLWSPRRAVGVAVALVAAIALWTSCSGPSKAATGQSIPRPWNSPTPSASPSATPNVAIPPAVTIQPTPPPDAVATAELFVTAWADKTDAGRIPTPGHPGWLAGAQKYADAHLAAGLSFTDPSRIAASKVTGPGSITATGPGGKLITVPTDDGLWSVTVVQAATGWQVDGIDRAR